MENFLTNKLNFILSTDLFLTHHYHIYIEKSSKYPVKAYEADFQDKKQHILSTIGEFFEREVLCNTNPVPYKTISMVSLITGEKKTVSISEVVFNGKFNDSCGMASHIFSEEVIWKAYKEFFERQSFVANFLFHLSAIKIKLDDNKEILKIDEYIKNYLDKIYYFNISLSNKIYVILALGWTKNSKAVGLGTSRKLENAIEKAQKEILQYYAVSVNKENWIDEDENIIEKKDSYQQYFDSLSVERFQELFSYLKECKTKFLSEEKKNVINEKTSEVIKNHYFYLNMEPYITLFNGRDNSGVKVVKIKDFNWFPHMRPELYPSNIITNLENKFKWKRKNFDKWLPFI